MAVFRAERQVGDQRGQFSEMVLSEISDKTRFVECQFFLSRAADGPPFLSETTIHFWQARGGASAGERKNVSGWGRKCWQARGRMSADGDASGG